LLLGSLCGALVMLIFAPQPGRVTRAQIFKRSTNLQD
jgi:gas vesicle protein